MQVNMLEAKSQLSRLVKAALEGEDVVIANDGKPVVRLVKIVDTAKTRGYGAWKGLIELGEDWDSVETNAAIANAIREAPLFPVPPVARGVPKKGAARPKGRKGRMK